MKCIRFAKFFAFMLCASWLLAGKAQATILNFDASLDPFQEVLPHNTPAYGQAELTLDDSSGLVTITTGTYSDLLGGALSVTLNGPAAVGTNAATLLILTLDTPGQTTGTFSGGGTLAAGNITDMENGNTYIHITDQVYPSGEIRGQVTAVPEPSTLVLAAFGMCGLLAAGGRRMRAKVV